MKYILLIGAIFTFVSCSSSPTHSVADKGTSTADYHTYQWITQTQANQLNLQNPHIDYVSGNVKMIRKPEIEQKVRPIVESDLSEAGYQVDTVGRPDFYVTFYAKAKDQDWVSSWEGNTPGILDVPVVIFPGFNRDRARDHRDGTVYLTFYDAKSKQPAWTGSVNSTSFGPQFGEPEVTAAIGQIVTEFKKAS